MSGLNTGDYFYVDISNLGLSPLAIPLAAVCPCPRQLFQPLMYLQPSTPHPPPKKSSDPIKEFKMAGFGRPAA
jgi:hypothetical protein